MAELTHSHYGDVSGTVGGITFAQRKGKIIMKKRNKAKTGEPTPKQVLVQEKFRKVGNLARSFKEMYLIGIEKANLGTMTEYNMFNKVNFKALSGTPGAITIDYSKINLGAGRLIPPGSLNKTVAGSTVTFNWTPDSGEPTDNIHLAAYNPTLDKLQLVPPAPRSAGTGSLSVPPGWSGHQIHTYAFARNENKNVSETIYGGDATIT